MPTLTVTDARKNLFGLVDEVADEHRGYCIVGKRNQAVLISMEDLSAIQESLYLNSFPFHRRGNEDTRLEVRDGAEMVKKRSMS